MKRFVLFCVILSHILADREICYLCCEVTSLEMAEVRILFRVAGTPISTGTPSAMNDTLQLFRLLILLRNFSVFFQAEELMRKIEKEEVGT